jgi:hypothetical protein
MAGLGESDDGNIKCNKEMIVDFLELLNKVARLNIPAYQDFIELENFDDPFKDTDLDSLSVLLVTMYISEIYGIPEDVAKEFIPKSPKELIEFTEEFGTRVPKTVEEAMSWI